MSKSEDERTKKEKIQCVIKQVLVWIAFILVYISVNTYLIMESGFGFGWIIFLLVFWLCIKLCQEIKENSIIKSYDRINSLQKINDINKENNKALNNTNYNIYNNVTNKDKKSTPTINNNNSFLKNKISKKPKDKKIIFITLGILFIIAVASFFIYPTFITKYSYDKQTQTLTIKGGIFSSNNEVYQIKGDYADCKNCIIEGKIYVIDNKAFSKCKSLKSVTMCDNITSIKSNAFDGCENLEDIKLSNSIDEIENETFKNCQNLVEINIPKKLEKIGEKAFKNCYSLSKINFPDTLKTIVDYAFENTNLRQINIPKQVNDIGYYAFDGCIALEKIIVDSNNSFYCSQDGVLFDKDKNILIAYPKNKKGTKYIVPKTVKTIISDLLSSSLVNNLYLPNDIIYFSSIDITSGDSGLENDWRLSTRSSELKKRKHYLQLYVKEDSSTEDYLIDNNWLGYKYY